MGQQRKQRVDTFLKESGWVLMPINRARCKTAKIINSSLRCAHEPSAIEVVWSLRNKRISSGSKWAVEGTWRDYFFLNLLGWNGNFLWDPAASLRSCEPVAKPIEIEIDNRRGIKGKQLRQKQAAHNGVAQRLAD